MATCEQECLHPAERSHLRAGLQSTANQLHSLGKLWADPAGQLLQTCALVLVSTGLCIVIGIPLGVLLASRPLARRLLMPLLDVMQTLPRGRGVGQAAGAGAGGVLYAAGLALMLAAMAGCSKDQAIYEHENFDDSGTFSRKYPVTDTASPAFAAFTNSHGFSAST